MTVTDSGARESYRVAIGRDEPIYRPDAGPDEPHFFRDVALWQRSRDVRAQDRLIRHLKANGHEVRDINSGAFGASVVPQFLDEEAAGPVRAGDPLLAALTQLPLPSEGLLFALPRSVTTGGSSAAAQTSDNTTVAETDPSLVNLDTFGRAVVTVAGLVTVASQVVDRGGSGFERYLMRDLREAVDTTLDNQLINGTGTNGQLLGLRNITAPVTVTWADAAPSQGLFVNQVARTAHDTSNVRLKPPDLVVMHPRRWYWLNAALATTQQDAATIVTGQACAEYETGVPYVGSIAGLPVIVDCNVPTTVSTDQDQVFVLRSQDMNVHVSDTRVTLLHQYDTGSALEDTFVAWRYAVWFPDRYRGTSTGILTGTGLTAPGSFTN